MGKIIQQYRLPHEDVEDIKITKVQRRIDSEDDEIPYFQSSINGERSFVGSKSAKSTRSSNGIY